jgi:hypothetical protein
MDQSRSAGKTDSIKTRYNNTHPCPACETGSKGCSQTEGGLIFCRGIDIPVGQVVNGYACLKNHPGDEFRTFRLDRPHEQNGRGPHATFTRSAPPLRDWTERHAKARERMTPERLAELAKSIGVPAAAVELLQPGFEYVHFDGPAHNFEPAFVFPMRDASGVVCGLAARHARTGVKKVLHGGNLGVFLPDNWREVEGPIFDPEGASDTAALIALGLPAVGRPSARAKLELLADTLGGCDREIIVLGEMDLKPTGEMPGQAGALATAKALALALRRPVSWSFTPGISKDVRVWCAEQGLTAESPIEEWRRVGEAFVAGLKLNQVKPPKDGEEDAELIQDAEDIPTLLDALACGASKRWLWEGWLQADLVNGLVGNFGAGKTRFVAELIRRIRRGEPWPDGQPMTLSRDSTFLFVPLDYQHSELIDLAQKYEFPPDCVYLNASKHNADGVSPFDTQQGVAALERRVAVLRPVFVVIDPITAGTSGLNLGRAEDATLIFSPLQRIARKYGTCFLILTHTNAQGGTYGRHGSGKFRTEIRLTKFPQDDGSDRYRIEVSKSNSKHPDPIGATQRDDCWEFDDNPPEANQEPGKGRPGPKPKALLEAITFLREHLSNGEQLQVELVKKWEDGGRAAKHIFAAAKELASAGEIVADERESPRGRKMLKTWMFVSKPPTEPPPEKSDKEDFGD